MKVKVTKLKEAENPKHPNNIETGYIREGDFIKPPKVGEPFYVGLGWRTSTVQEVGEDGVFKTHNSIYKYEIIKDAN